MTPLDTLTGTTLQGRYAIEHLLGQGGMGAVYRARDSQLQRAVAIKVLESPGLGTEGRRRLEREARAAAALNHPNIVGVYDVGEDAGRPFIVMELVEGGSLREAAPLDVPAAVRLARQLCEALDHAHGHGIVHRDLKPENVLLASGGTAKLADLGVALAPDATHATMDGGFVGTAAYLAPEQALGLAVDGRTDLYALGVLLYELVARRLPFAGDDALVVISQHLHAPVTPPRTFRHDLPPAVEAIILRLLAKDPAQRFPTARALAEALDDAARHTAPAPEAAPASGALLEQLVRGRLVGRATQLQQLRDLWRHTQQGHGQMALISGEPGAGKTRLAAEGIVHARIAGAVVLRGGCYEYEASVPYLPFVEALRRWTHEESDERIRQLAGPSASELAKLAPELESRIGPLAPSPALAPHEERLRLYDHVTRFLQALAAERGLLFFVDDLHWADEGTLGLLHYVVRNLRDARLLVLGTYREVELDRRHPLSSALVEWNRERLSTRIPLERFRPEETAAQLATLLGQDTVTPDFAALVHRETEGNPFFVEEVVKALIEQGQIYRADGEWNRREIADLTVPQSIKAAVGRRLDRLSPACVEALHTAAALGKSFAFAELTAAGGTEEALLDAIDEAVGAQLLAATGVETFVFTHDKIREVLIEELNPIRRRRLHQRIGEGLERLHAGRLEPHVTALAHHFGESGDLERGLTYSLQAAARAADVYAHQESLAFLERARECAEALQREDALADIHERIGRVHAFQGDVGRTIESYQRALEYAKARDRRAALKLGLGEICCRVGDRRGVPYLEQAMAELDPVTQADLLALATGLIGRYHHYDGHPLKAIPYLEQALALVEGSRDRRLAPLISGYLAGANQHLARLDESERYAQMMVEGGRRDGDPSLESLGLEFLAESSWIRGRWAQSIALTREEQFIARRIGSQDRLVWALGVEAWGLTWNGDLDAGAHRVTEAVDLATRIGEERLRMVVEYICLPRVHAFRGERAALEAFADALDARAEPTGQLLLRQGARYARAMAFAAAGDWPGVLRMALDVAALMEGKETSRALALTGALHAEALVALGRFAEADAVIDECLGWATPIGNRAAEGHLEVLRAESRAAVGESVAASEGFVRGIFLLVERDRRIELARALARRAAWRDAWGEPAGAEQDRSRSSALLARCGALADLFAAPARPR